MATWMTHFRITDKLCDAFEGNVNTEKFIVGNIAPDSGLPNAEGYGFVPPKIISHFHSRTDGGDRAIDPQRFFDEYLCAQWNLTKKSFLLGYYTHLLCDRMWIDEILKPCKIKYINDFMTDSEYIYRIKYEWYRADFMFLRENPAPYSFQYFTKLESFTNEYLPFFPENAFEMQIKNIDGFYKTAAYDSEQPLKYITAEQLTSFVDESAAKIVSTVKKQFIDM